MGRRWRAMAGAALFGLVALVIGACGGGGGSSAGTADPTADIQIYSQKDPGLEDLLKQQITEFEALHKTITVKIVHYETEQLRTNFQTAAIAHTGPELVYGPNDNIGPWVTLKILQPIDKVLGADFLKEFSNNAVGAVSYKGHVYAVPDINGNHLMLLYNKKLVTGSAPTTTDQLISMATALTDKSKNQYGIAFNENEAYWLMPWLGGFGGAVFDANTKPTLNTQAMIDALTFERSLKTQGVAPATADYAKADSLFTAGQAAFLINGDWSLSGYKKALGDNLGIAPLPMVTKTGKWAAPYTASRGYSINAAATGDALRAAEMFLQFISQTNENLKVAALGNIPANAAAANDPSVKNDPILGASAAALVHGVPQPIVPEMRAVYDAIATPLADVMNGKTTPAAAAAVMESDAISRIAQLQQ
ncbi:MAG TPA: extracellular solute-binding protein [Candidatus Dormibacteraeota bacterium]|nr:extracellular solute-binding protein [Candidatus Dormibacteraeota bacterium]